jgi:hypothetical protein
VAGHAVASVIRAVHVSQHGHDVHNGLVSKNEPGEVPRCRVAVARGVDIEIVIPATGGVRHVDIDQACAWLSPPPALALSLSPHRHPFLCIPPSSR